MKRTGILTACILLAAQLAFGQTVKTFGLKGGISVTGQSFQYKERGLPGPDKGLNSFSAGAFVELNRKDPITLLVEMYYIRKGSAFQIIITDESGPEPKGSTHWEYWIDYLSIPVMGKFNLQKQHSNFYGLIGPRLDIRLNQSDELVGYDIQSEQMQEIYKDYHRVDLGLELGIGVERAITSSFDLIVEFRYSPSITPVYNSESCDIQNHSCQLLMGFHL